MIAIEVIVLVALVIAALRMRPPERAIAPRWLSLLAGIATVAFGVAMGSIIIVASERVFSLALLVAGLSGVAFLWLVRAEPEDDDEGGDEPPQEQPPGDGDGGQKRFSRKRTRVSGPRAPSGTR